MNGDESKRDGAHETSSPPGRSTDSGTATDATRDGDPWRADRPESIDDFGTLWIRWTDGGSDLHLHRICAVVPQLSVGRTWPFVRVRPERGDRPTFEPVRDDSTAANSEPVRFQFISGLPRFFLRHTPLVIFVAAVVLLVGAEFTPGVDGVSQLVPPVSGENAMLLLVYLAILPVMLWLLSLVDVVEHREFPRAGFVYGLALALAAGIAIAVFFVVTASHPSQTPPSVVFVSGYLLVLLVGGQLLYEATLRIEHLFVGLAEREGDIIDDHRAYRRFLTDLHDSLRFDAYGLSPSRVFGVLFAAQFAIFWLIGEGPQNLNYTLGIWVNFVLNAVLATVSYQFLVLIRYFNHLVNETPAYSDVGLRYEPFHVDGHGGFRDFGRFASRINVILTLGGLFLVYRLYVVGTRGLPVEGLAGFSDPILLTVWLLSFAGPVVAYALGAGAWGYYSFWSMHAKMVRDKYRLARRYQGSNRDVDLDRTPAAGDRIGSFEDSEGPEWSALRDAPTWPLDVNKMASLLSGNVLPLLVPLVGFL